MITDPDAEGIRLLAEPMDVTLGKDGKWHGAHADALNAALRVADHGFTWPRMLKDIILTNAAIEPLDFDHLLSPVAKRAEYAHVLPQLRERAWPATERQSRIPSSLPFRIVGKAGARLKGTYCREIT